MPKFLFIYHGEPPATQEAGEASMAAWGKWMGDHAAALVDPGNPVGASWTVDGAGARKGATLPSMGYSVVEAADIEAACEIAAGCPMVSEGGDVEVAEIIPM